ncbi:MAG: hypothetical protein A2V90_06070 [Gammaproteobacteria bacterium RBG_16_57_12]|nr:MAG: hypothetical protein A2V90_06070 [Gammaproteobacteria bacterium RBG_16_57_12]
MTALSKTEAQQRADQIRAFQNELALLGRDRILTLDEVQRRALDEYHAALLAQYSRHFDIDQTQRERHLSLGMRIASFLGALALAASVFFLFYQFWGRLATGAQVLILIAAPLVTFALTAFIAAKETSGYFAKLMAMVSFACFVLNLSMLGQIFNITPSDQALLVWAAYAFLLAYAFDIRLLLAAGILCLVAFISARMGTWSGIYWLHFGERPENFLLPAILMFWIPRLIAHRRFSGFAPIYRVFGLLIFFIPVLILSLWGQISYLDLAPGLIEGGYQIAGFVLSALAIWLGIRQGWHEVVNTGTSFFFLFLYTKFFDWWWEIMPKYLFFLVLGLAAILFIFVLKRLRGVSRRQAPGVGA